MWCSWRSSYPGNKLNFRIWSQGTVLFVLVEGLAPRLNFRILVRTMDEEGVGSIH